MSSVTNLTASAVLVAGLTCSPATAAQSNLDGWVSACNTEKTVTSRVGQVTASELRAGMKALHQFDHLTAISALPAPESCLSFVASAHQKMPVVVMFADVSDQARQQHPSALARMRQHYEREHHADRLTKANIALYPAMLTDPDNEEQLQSINRGALIGAKDHQGAYAATTGIKCAISLPKADFASERKKHQPFVWAMLGKSDKAYLQENGDSIVFWHEVAHCNTDRAAEHLSQTGKRSDQLGEYQSERAESMEACTDTALVDQWTSQMQARQITATRPEHLAEGEIDRTTMTQMIHFSLLQESVADQAGTLMSRKRLNQGEMGCTSKTELSHPWYRYRLTSSVRDPDARYMTWITPWLTGLPEPSIHQVLRDAHKGMMQAAKATLSEPMWMELNHARMSRPNKHLITDPQGPTDSERVKAWSEWATDTLERAKQSLSLNSN